MPLLWVCAAQVLARARPQLAALAIMIMLAMTTWGYRAWSPFPGGVHYDPTAYAVSEHKRIGRQILDAIPPETSLAIQSRLGSHLATREQLYVFPWIDWDALPETIVLDTSDPRPNPMFPAELAAFVRRLQLEPTIRTVVEQDGYIVFETGQTASFPRATPRTWSPWLNLDGFELAQASKMQTFVSDDDSPQPGRLLRVMLYWTAQSQMNRDYVVSVRLTAPDGTIVAEHTGKPGGGDIASSSWITGRTLRDTHYLSVPGELPASLSLVVVVGELNGEGRLQPLAPTEGSVLQTWTIRP